MDVNALVRSIYVQITEISCSTGRSANLIILGRQVYEHLEAYTRGIMMHTIEIDETKPIYMFGMRVIIDEVDVNRVSVCVGYDISIIKEGK